MADTEKVIKELEQLKHCLTKPCDITCSYYNAEDMICPCSYDVSSDVVIDNAIQTIRELQSKEEVCEWKYPSLLFEDGNEVFEVECNKNPLKHKSIPNNFSFTDFKYCPYCGRKIKVVE